MVVELRRVPPEVARQALVNKVLGWTPIADAEVASVDVAGLDSIATGIAVPELLPYEYVYVDIYTDGRGGFFAAIDRRQRTRHRAPRTVPA